MHLNTLSPVLMGAIISSPKPMPNCTALTYLSSLDAGTKTQLTSQLSPIIHSYIRRLIAKNSDRLRMNPVTTDGSVIGEHSLNRSGSTLDRLNAGICQFHFHGSQGSIQKLILDLEQLALSHQVLSSYPNHPDYSHQLQIIEQGIFQLLGLEVIQPFSS